MKAVNKHLDKIKGLLRWFRTTMKVAIDRDLLDLKIRSLFASPCWRARRPAR